VRLWEIVNPSDPYTFRAPDFKVAAVVALWLGNGTYGLRACDRGDGT